VADEAVVDADEPAVTLVTDAFAEAHAIDRRELLGCGSPRAFGTDIEERGHRDQGPCLVNRGQTQVMEQAERLGPEERDRHLLACCAPGLAKRDRGVRREWLAERDGCRSAVLEGLDRRQGRSIAHFGLYGPADPRGLACHIDRQLRTVTENAPGVRHPLAQAYSRTGFAPTSSNEDPSANSPVCSVTSIQNIGSVLTLKRHELDALNGPVIIRARPV
jgi:hypothetical protein